MKYESVVLMRSGILKYRFGLLLVFLSGAFFAYPLALVATGGVAIVNVIETLMVLAAVAIAPRRHTEAYSLWILGLLAVLADWVNDYGWGRHVFASAAESGLYALFFAQVALQILKAVFAPSRVTANELLGACSVYLLLAIIWAHLFHIATVVSPDCVHGISEGGNDGALQSDLLYFSLTTLTTSGIGDIVPVGRAARMLTAVEAVVGQLYLAVLVGRFVGLYTAQVKTD